MSGVVLVTGASTGIGEALARRLAATGVGVLAGVRREEDARRLEADPSGLVEAVHLDVTSAADVAGLAERVGNRPLRGVVNNAGMAVLGPVELLVLEDWRRVLDVNLLGAVAVTHALLPALLRSRGRVVNISSIAGRVAAPLFGPYAASKFAVEAFTDVLRRELLGTGVHVVAVQPGVIATPIWDKGRAEADEILERADVAQLRRYGDLMRAARALAAHGKRRGSSPDAVAAIVVRALTARRPRTRYLVGLDARVEARLVGLVPDRAVDAVLRRMAG
ncbi:MAG: SDR family NAD(P)-dependent oxidoreductase [Actinomycetota bacterium]|nr:SDR family NAD(P)-dependent oxidoreductase [Actinomycetota bacterium]